MRIGNLVSRKRFVSPIFFIPISGASESGDVVLRCGINGMIDILDIKMNDTDLQEQETERIKQQCATKAFQNDRAPQQSIGHKQPVFCPVLRQGRDGKLKVRYQCLPVPTRVLDPVLRNKVNSTGSVVRRHVGEFRRPDKRNKHAPKN